MRDGRTGQDGKFGRLIQQRPGQSFPTDHVALRGEQQRNFYNTTMNLAHDSWGRLVYTDDAGVVHVGVEPVRAFPISNPNQGVSLLDHHGDELAWIDDPRTLADAPRRLLEEELSRRHFLPTVRAIRNVEGLTDPTTWHVDTDRGPARFQVKSYEDVRRIASHRVVVVDAHGVRYLIADYRTLDAVSRRFLERFI